MQLNARRMFHNDILAANSVGGVIAPVKDFWRWHGCIKLNWEAHEDAGAGLYPEANLRLTICDDGYF